MHSICVVVVGCSPGRGNHYYFWRVGEAEPTEGIEFVKKYMPLYGSSMRRYLFMVDGPQVRLLLRHPDTVVADMRKRDAALRLVGAFVKG